MPQRETIHAALKPVALIVFGCFCFSLYVFYPGWMSPDSFFQYSDAKAGEYRTWQPVFMAWWWGKLIQLWDGPQPVLIQNLCFYWGAWFLLSLWAARRVGRAAAILPLFGLWPGIAFPLGQIWKDIWFAAPMMFAWALLLHASARPGPLTWTERGLLVVALVMSIGVKPNGLVALPFVVVYWVLLERHGSLMSSGKLVLRASAATALIAAVPALIAATLPLRHQHPLQYTQTYDLLAISVATGENLLPAYLKERLGPARDLRALYFVGGKNLLFYNTVGNITTEDPGDLDDLRRRWISSILDHPMDYLRHRLNNFMSLMRLGESSAAYVAVPRVDANQFGIADRPTVIGAWLQRSLTFAPWMYFPWIYAVVLVASAGLLIWLSGRWREAGLISASAAAFVAPHVFIAPAADYRYLYYAYLCAMALFVMALTEGVARLRGRGHGIAPAP